MNTQELIELISSKYPIYSLYEVDNLINDKVKKVSNQQDSKKIYINKVDENQWYIIATNVYKCTDGYVGIMGPCKLYSDKIDWKDINFTCEAYKYDKIHSISYVRKSQDDINKSIESTIIGKSPEEAINSLLNSENADDLTLEKIKHIKNIFKEVSELNKLNFEGSAYAFIAMLFMFISGGAFNTNDELNNSKI